MYNSIQNQAAAVKDGPGGDSAASQKKALLHSWFESPSSLITKTAEAGTSGGGLKGGDGDAEDGINPNSLDECCICLERKPDVILPCAHSYCLPCIEQWNVDHKTCPVCRDIVTNTDDSWVISDVPDSLEIVTEIQKSLMELAH